MNKEKQIEEMTQDLFSAYAINKLYTKDVAEYLYNAGYRKVPEGAIVLTRTELDALNAYQKKLDGGGDALEKE